MRQSFLSLPAQVAATPPLPDACLSSVQKGHPGHGPVTAFTFAPTDPQFSLGPRPLQHLPHPDECERRFQASISVIGRSSVLSRRPVAATPPARPPARHMRGSVTSIPVTARQQRACSIKTIPR